MSVKLLGECGVRDPRCKVAPCTIFCTLVSDIVGFSVTLVASTMFLLPLTSM